MSLLPAKTGLHTRAVCGRARKAANGPSASRICWSMSHAAYLGTAAVRSSKVVAGVAELSMLKRRISPVRAMSSKKPATKRSWMSAFSSRLPGSAR